MFNINDYNNMSSVSQKKEYELSINIEILKALKRIETKLSPREVKIKKPPPKIVESNRNRQKRVGK